MIVAAYVVMVVVVVAGVVAQLVRPLAPDLGPVPDPGQWFAVDLLSRVAAYRAPLRVAAVVGVFSEVVVPVWFVTTATGRGLVTRIATAVGVRRPARAAAAVVLTILAASALVSLPLSLWAYAHGRAYGLIVQSTAAWLGEWVAVRAVELAGAGAVTVVGAVLVGRWPRRWFLLAAPLGVAVVAVLVAIAPLVVEPLRLPTAPLADGPLRQRLEPLLDRAGGTDTTLLVARASTRTTRQNAYVSGLWGTRRIVLYDTLLERPADEVALVLAHELAHDQHRDLLRGVAGGAAGWVLGCLMVHMALSRAARAGRLVDRADPRGAALALAIVVVLLTVTTPLTSWVSRRAEAAADATALRLTDDAAAFCSVQRGFVETNLTDPAPPGWQRWWWATHPPVTSRLAMGAGANLSAATCRPHAVIGS